MGYLSLTQTCKDMFIHKYCCGLYKAHGFHVSEILSSKSRANGSE